MTIDIAFKSLKIVDERKAISRNKVPRARGATEKKNRIETIRRELKLRSRNFSSKIMRPNCQSSSALKFVKLRYRRRKVARTITMKIYFEKAR